VVADGERFERLRGRLFGHPAGSLDGVFEAPAERAIEWWHG
jgi:hypothetical protein